MGHIAYQLPFLPVLISLDTDGKITVSLNAKIAVGRGLVTVADDQVIRPDGTSLSPAPADVTQLIICQPDGTVKRCEAYQVNTGRKIRIEMNGNFIQTVERNRIGIDAAPGAIIKLTDAGPPTRSGEVRGPARIDAEELDFQEAGRETEVDLERSRSGTTTDLSYDHVSGEIKAIHGAKVASYATWGWWGPGERSDYPGEEECFKKEAADWGDAFNADDLKARYSSFCVKTAEGDLGFLFIEPNFNQKPISYHVIAYTWVR